MSRKFVLSQEQREKIANRIREVIFEHGYKTMSEFADEWQISDQTLQNWVKDGNVNLAFLFVFCEKFNIDLRWVLQGPAFPKHKKPSPQ